MPRLWYLKPGDTGIPDFIDIDGELPQHEQDKQLIAAVEREFSRTHWEHVSVWYNKRCHMFVDEIGRLMNLPINPKGTLIYKNATDRRAGKKTYDDVTLWEPPYEFDQRFLIVGPALLWTGELE